LAKFSPVEFLLIDLTSVYDPQVSTMKKITALITALMLSASASANVLMEDFSDLPGWQEQWFGSQSNAKNFYEVASIGPASYRGNNPDGLWLDDNDGVTGDTDLSIVFNSEFANSLSLFSVDVASSLNDVTLVFFDAQGQNFFSQSIAASFSAGSSPAGYQNFTISSFSGISGFSFISSSNVEGNVSIDNLFAFGTPTAVATVPEPGSMLLIGVGLLGLMLHRLRMN
jgi:hypothetical protein